MDTLTLFGADRFQPSRFLAVVRRQLGPTGAACWGRVEQDRLVVTLECAPHQADEVARLVTDAWLEWRRAWGPCVPAVARFHAVDPAQSMR